MESKSLAYWCESLCGYHSVWRYLTELGLWGKIVSYRTSQKETREIAYQCWSPNSYYFGCALQTFGGTEEKNQLLTQVQDTQKCLCAQQHSEVVWKDSDTKSLITGQAKWHNITTYCDFIGSSIYEILQTRTKLFRYNSYVAEGYKWTDITPTEKKATRIITCFEKFPTMFRNV